MFDKTYDLIIVGAGPVGSVIAERAASMHGYSSLVLDKRNHIAGNCYDSEFSNGVKIHNYGPHYFRTNDQEVVDYLSQFTEWINGNYIVKSEINGKLFPFPINLDTLEMFFGLSDLDKDSASALLNKLKIEFNEPKNSEEFVLSRVGKELYEAFYLNYTKKQWAMHPSELAVSVCGRIPVKLNRDPYYVEAKFKQMPKDGYTAMFEKMLNHPSIQLSLNTDYFEIKSQLRYNVATIYTGPIDRFFNFQYGKLDWRSLEFKFEEIDKEFEQDCVQINYPNNHEYTRSVEIKHVTKQKHNKTVVCKEFPNHSGDPFYPIPDQVNRDMYLKYKQLADSELLKSRTHFVGRLAEYTYINTDEAIRKALDISKRI